MPATKQTIQGLYVITDPTLSPGLQLLDDVAAALKGGANIVQYRDKVSSDLDKLANAKYLQALCQQHQATFIINDDIELAKMIGADGVHIGKNDTDLHTARQQLGQQAIIGVSCYNDLDRAKTMRAQGADYVAFGRFFPSKTKPDAPQAEIDTLIQAKQQLDCPIVAIGGITADNAETLLEAGADALAVIQGVFVQPDIQFATQTLVHKIQAHQKEL